jgi:hypothetical protein
MTDLLEDYSLLSEDELDEKINDILRKIEIAYSMGHGVALQQLEFHLENMKLELGDKLEKQRFNLVQGKTPEQYTVTDDGKLIKEEEGKE